MPSRSRQPNRGKKRKHTRTWTANFMCLSDSGQTKVPVHTQKVCLQKAGLGLKKVVFHISNDEQDVHDILQSERGFPKLNDSVGFEMMYCASNCRDLQLIKCKWDVEQLKSSIGSQSRIYIRPIQRNLELDEVSLETSCQLKVKCESCDENVNITDLRNHMKNCSQREASGSMLMGHPSGSENVRAGQPSGSENVHVGQLRGSENVHAGQPSGSENVHVGQPSGSENVHAGQPSGSENVHVGQPSGSENVHAGQPSGSENVHAGPPSGSENVHAGQPSGSENVHVGQPSGSENVHAVQPSGSENVHVGQPSGSVVESLESLDTYYLIENIPETTIQQVVENCIKEISELQITDPIACLRYLQTRLVTGRQLEFGPEDIYTGITGETSFIIDDRNNLLASSIEEVSGIENLRLTLEVQFSGETAEDYGGPRREFFSLVLQEIKQKYLDPLREWAPPEECETIGKILALSMLQNGRLPRVFSADMLENMFGTNPHPVLLAMKKGMDALGICELIHAHPFLIHLLTPGISAALTLKKFTHLLQPDFSPVGANRRTVETEMYQRFVKYLREVAGGRRGGLDLGYVLKFVSGSVEEPPLGFVIQPSISFQQRSSFLPTANTCIYKLYLTIPNGSEVPNNEMLFGLFDYAFANNYFGLA